MSKAPEEDTQEVELKKKRKVWLQAEEDELVKYFQLTKDLKPPSTKNVCWSNSSSS